MKQLVIGILIAVVISALYSEWAARRAVISYEERDFVYWKSKLMPLYESSPGMRLEKEPSNKEELFEPLFRLTTPVIK